MEIDKKILRRLRSPKNMVCRNEKNHHCRPKMYDIKYFELNKYTGVRYYFRY
jgi:hypothetical protein